MPLENQLEPQSQEDFEQKGSVIDLEELNNRLYTRRLSALQNYVREYIKNQLKTSREFKAPVSDKDIFTIAFELIRYRATFSYRAIEDYAKFCEENIHHEPDPRYPTTDVYKFFKLVFEEKRITLDDRWKPFIEEVLLIASKIPPEVEVNKNVFFAEQLLPIQSLMLEDLASGRELDLVELEEIKEKEAPSEGKPSYGLEIEQSGLDLIDFKRIDGLQKLGFRVEQDAEREIIFPPTHNLKLTKTVFQEMRNQEYILDKEPAIHLTVGGIEDPKEHLADLFLANALFSATADNSFRTSDPNVKPFEEKVDSPGRSSKNIFQGRMIGIGGFPFRIKKSGLVEFRSLFDLKYSDEAFFSGLSSVEAIISQLSRFSQQKENNWQEIKEIVFANLNSVLGLPPKENEENLQAFFNAQAAFIKLRDWLDEVGNEEREKDREKDYSFLSWNYTDFDQQIATLAEEQQAEYKRRFNELVFWAIRDPYIDLGKETDPKNISITTLHKYYGNGRRYRRICSEITRKSFLEDKKLGNHMQGLIDHVLQFA